MDPDEMILKHEEPDQTLDIYGDEELYKWYLD